MERSCTRRAWPAESCWPPSTRPGRRSTTCDWRSPPRSASESSLGFDVIAPLSKADAVVVEDADPHPDDTVHNAVLFVLGLDATTLLQHGGIATVPPGVRVSPSGLPWSVELTAPGVHKGSAVAHLCERLGVGRRGVFVFGDGLNDHELLLWAGRGVAMGNAGEETKSIADEVTASSDDDGVAVVVERLLGGHQVWTCRRPLTPRGRRICRPPDVLYMSASSNPAIVGIEPHNVPREMTTTWRR